MNKRSVVKLEVMSPRQKVAYFLLQTFGVAITTFFFIWWFLPSHIAHNFTGYWHVMDYGLFALLSYVIWYQIVNECFSWFVAGFMKRPAPMLPERNMSVAFLTAFVPGAEPYDILERTLSAMVDTEYPHDTWLLDEGNDPKAIAICKKLGVHHFSRKGIEKYNTALGPYRIKTKGGNYNSWFDTYGAKYEFVAQLDVDFVPKRDYLIKTLGYFRDPTVAFVGTPQIYGNVADSWIVRGAAEQAYGFYGSMQKGFFGLDMTLFIGANHVLRTAAHNDIEGYSGHIVEDHLTGMRFYAKQWKSVYVPEALAIGEGPATWSAYFSQQMRWAYGLIDILFRHSPRIFRDMRRDHIVNYFLLQQYYFYGLSQILGIILLSLYFFFGIEITPMPLIPLLAIYVPLLLYQQVFFVWLQRFNVDPKRERGLMLRAKILNWAVWPVYFLALIGVLTKKRLTYVVTPKGKRHNAVVASSLFYPHVFLGMLTLACAIAGLMWSHVSPLLMFWSVVNTLLLFGFFFSVMVHNGSERAKVAIAGMPTTRFVRPAFAGIFLIIVGVSMTATYIASFTYTEHEKEVVDSFSVAYVQPTPAIRSRNRTIEHTVTAGETRWKIAKAYYGRGSAWQDVHTPGNSPTIHPGDIVTLDSNKIQ
jgi:cellulose synthase/poly-beta-1,6-N-acetylglucosamine synthase-like glycosyltransferase